MLEPHLCFIAFLSKIVQSASGKTNSYKELLIELFFKPIGFLTGDLFLSFKDTFLATEGFSDDDSTLLLSFSSNKCLVLLSDSNHTLFIECDSAYCSVVLTFVPDIPTSF